MAATLTTEAAKTAADISVKSLTQILTLLIANSKNMSERKKNLIRDIITKPHDVFLVPKENLRGFAQRCKEYNIPFYVAHRYKSGPEPFVDVIIREMDRGAVNRIAEKMGITLSYIEQAAQSMEHLRSRADNTDIAQDNDVTPAENNYTISEDFLSQVLGTNERNPTMAQTENLSAPLFDSNESFVRDFNGIEPTSVRTMMRVIRAERAALPAGREALGLPEVQHPLLPAAKIPQLPASSIDMKGR